ncbi:hypothetical protein [Rhodoplanes roseus]|uniref:hypothetical protein n=1 Tax=Rhodoplanes roseus TaxID=29409 RepID=UPI0026CBE276
MPEVYQTEAFSRWLRGLRDVKARQKIVVRLMRLADGNPGDVAPVGRGSASFVFTMAPATGSTSRNAATPSWFSAPATSLRSPATSKRPDWC